MHPSRLILPLLFLPATALLSQSPSAGQRAATTQVPIGGLQTRPIPPGSGAFGRPRRALPYYVTDAPLARGGVVVPAAPTPPVSNPSTRTRPSWIPTAQKPRWVVDSTLPPVQAWRDLIVTDVVCNLAGDCRERRQTVRAKWVARCGCYAFGDGWNRIWRVE